MSKTVISLKEATNDKTLNPVATQLLELRDIIGFSAEYLQQVFESQDNTEQQEVIASLCKNLQRGREALEKEISTSGEDVQDLEYNPFNFVNVSFLNTNMIDVVTQFTEQRQKMR